MDFVPDFTEEGLAKNTTDRSAIHPHQGEQSVNPMEQLEQDMRHLSQCRNKSSTRCARFGIQRIPASPFDSFGTSFAWILVRKTASDPTSDSMRCVPSASFHLACWCCGDGFRRSASVCAAFIGWISCMGRNRNASMSENHGLLDLPTSHLVPPMEEGRRYIWMDIGMAYSYGVSTILRIGSIF